MAFQDVQVWTGGGGCKAVMVPPWRFDFGEGGLSAYHLDDSEFLHFLCLLCNAVHSLKKHRTKTTIIWIWWMFPNLASGNVFGGQFSKPSSTGLETFWHQRLTAWSETDDGTPTAIITTILRCANRGSKRLTQHPTYQWIQKKLHSDQFLNPPGSVF